MFQIPPVFLLLFVLLDPENHERPFDLTQQTHMKRRIEDPYKSGVTILVLVHDSSDMMNSCQTFDRVTQGNWKNTNRVVTIENRLILEMTLLKDSLPIRNFTIPLIAFVAKNCNETVLS